MATIDTGTIRTTITMTRPNTLVAWDRPSPEQEDYIRINYLNTGKKSVGDWDVSEDGLIKTWVGYYLDEDAKDEWDTDSSIEAFIAARELYCEENNIIHNVVHVDV